MMRPGSKVNGHLWKQGRWEWCGSQTRYINTGRVTLNTLSPGLPESKPMCLLNKSVASPSVGKRGHISICPKGRAGKAKAGVGRVSVM